MAWDDEYRLPKQWSDTEKNLYDNVVGSDPRVAEDPYLQGLFDHTLFKGVGGREWEFARSELMQYLWDEYEIDFDLDFEWEEWRRWYEETHS